ncbi:MAG: cysteinyl-tRNA synthetase, partial [Maribacter sp.]
YRSTLDLSDEALGAAEKGYSKLMEGNQTLQDMEYIGKENITDEDKEVNTLMDQSYLDMDDDFNTPKALSRLFPLINKINSFKSEHISINSISKDTFLRLKKVFNDFLFEIFGLLDETQSTGGDGEVLDGLMELIIDIRKESRVKKDWGTSDQIRDKLNELKIKIKDGKEGSSWALEK